MTHPRTYFTAAMLLLLWAGPAFPLSMLRPGEPRVKFNRFVGPERAEHTEEFKITAFVTPLQNIWEDEYIFLHIIKPEAVMSEYPSQGWEQQGIVINANAAPLIPSQRWVVGEDVQLGPITISIPKDLPPGEYLYQMGLFYIADPVKKVFIREPYTNKEIKDWIVGTIRVGTNKKVNNDRDVEVILSDFETFADVKKWESVRQGEIGLVTGLQALDGSYSGLLAYPTQAYLPLVMLQSFFQNAPPEYTDWERYDHLEFLFQGEFAPRLANDATKICIQIKDVDGSRYQRRLFDMEKEEYTKKPAETKNDSSVASGGKKNNTAANNNKRRIVNANRNSALSRDRRSDEEETLPQQPIYRMVLPIADIASRIDVSNIGHLGFWAHGLPEDQNWFLTAVIDDIKLVSKAGRKPDWMEPFVVFEGYEGPETAAAGGVMEVSLRFSIARKFRQNYAIFVHAIQEKEPHFPIQIERYPFRSTSTWEVGKIHREGPFYIPIPHDAPPGKYFVNAGLFRTREEIGGPVRYVNTYQWADGIFTEEQPTKPIDFIKEAYVNRTSREKWTVGHVTILSKEAKPSPEKAAEEEKRMMGIVEDTKKEILDRPGPSEIQQRITPVKRLERIGD